MHDLLQIARRWRDYASLNKEKGGRRGWRKRYREKMLWKLQYSVRDPSTKKMRTQKEDTERRQRKMIQK